ncbi:MAG: zf-HC2 domain-containing protein [Bryobacteraceae bacterium]
MHAVIIDDLEEYLAGTLPPSAQRRFQAHLETCNECNREVSGMQEVTGLFAMLKTAEPVEPGPSFVAQVMQTVERRPSPSFWSPFSDFAFGRRVVFASLLTLAVLGTVLVSRESGYTPEPTTPEAAFAADSGSPTADHMLVTLASYEP